MRLSTLVVVAASLAWAPAMAQHASPNQSLQDEADKGVKTRNSGASGFVGNQETPGAASHAPGQPATSTDAGSATS
jgi:hypothetical protein